MNLVEHDEMKQETVVFGFDIIHLFIIIIVLQGPSTTDCFLINFVTNIEVQFGLSLVCFVICLYE